MIRFWGFFWLAILTLPAAADAIKIRSGEHADFSRIVLQANDPEGWVFGRVKGGYELRLRSLEPVFDFSDVYKFIPRTRIKAARSSGPGRLFLKVSCPCSGDAFELQNGRIVLDIKNGEPLENSPFEVMLSDLPTSAITKAERSEDLFTIFSTLEMLIDPDAQDISSEIQTSSASPNENAAVSESTGSASDLPTVTDSFLDIQNPTPSEYSGVYAQISKQIPVFSDPISAIERDSEMQKSLEFPERNGSENDQSEKQEIDIEFQPFDIPIPSSRMAQKALLGQLQRAAAQGLIKVPSTMIEKSKPKTERLVVENRPDTSLAHKNNSEPASIHISISTAIDRDSTKLPNLSVLTSDGRECLANELFEVRDWGNTEEINLPFGNARALLVGEFDKVDQQVLLNLVRRNIYLGFGIEAKSMIKSFNQDITSEGILLELADIMDGKPPSPQAIMHTQISCSNAAALWAVLSHQQIPAGANLDNKMIIQTFAGLPIHLRQHLGPRLAQRFLDNDDLKTAVAIGNLVERGSSIENQNSNLIRARIAAKEGESEKSMSILNSIAKHGGPASPTALVELIDSQVMSGQPINEADAMTADALAVEFRGTEMGNKLLRVAVNGLALSGDIQKTFERIETALRTGDILVDEAEILRAETHLKNVLNSSDEKFLTIIFRHEFSDLDTSDASQNARLAIAERLVALGFMAAAKNTLNKKAPPVHDKERLLLAKIALSEQQLDSARDLLNGVDGHDAKLLLAQVSETERDYLSSAKIYEQLSMKEAQISASWRGGDWATVASLGSPLQADTAEIAMQGIQSDHQNGTRDSSGADVGSEIEELSHLASGKSLLLQSQNARQVFSELLSD